MANAGLMPDPDQMILPPLTEEERERLMALLPEEEAKAFRDKAKPAPLEVE